MKCSSNLWKLKLFHFTRPAITFLIPVIVLFWQDHGLSMTQIMILQAVFSIVMLGLEVPSGYFADIYGRKRTLMLSSFAMFLGLVVYAFSYGFWGFFAAEMFIAISISALSGTNSALLYDTLLDLKREDEFKDRWGKLMSIMMTGMLIATLAGGYIASFDLRWPIYVALPVSLVSLVVAMFFIEPERHKKLMKKNYMRQLLSVIREKIFCSPKMLSWSIVNALLFTSFMSSLWFYNPYFEWVGLPLVWWGVIFAACNGVAAFSARFAPQFERVFGLRGGILFLFALIGFSYIGMAHFQSIWALAFIAGSQIVRGVLDVLINDVVNKEVESDVRATVLSGTSMIGRVLYSVVILLLGVLMDSHGLQLSFYVLGAGTLFAGVLALGLLFGPASSKIKA